MITLTINVAGVSFRLDQFTAAQVAIRDDVTFEPEPENKYDPNAVKVLKGTHHLGYVPRDKAVQFLNLIDDKSIKSAKIVKAWSKGCNVEVQYEK